MLNFNWLIFKVWQNNINFARKAQNSSGKAAAENNNDADDEYSDSEISQSISDNESEFSYDSSDDSSIISDDSSIISDDPLDNLDDLDDNPGNNGNYIEIDNLSDEDLQNFPKLDEVTVEEVNNNGNNRNNNNNNNPFAGLGNANIGGNMGFGSDAARKQSIWQEAKLNVSRIKDEITRKNFIEALKIIERQDPNLTQERSMVVVEFAAKIISFEMPALFTFGLSESDIHKINLEKILNHFVVGQNDVKREIIQYFLNGSSVGHFGAPLFIKSFPGAGKTQAVGNGVGGIVAYFYFIEKFRKGKEITIEIAEKAYEEAIKKGNSRHFFSVHNCAQEDDKPAGANSVYRGSGLGTLTNKLRKSVDFPDQNMIALVIDEADKFFLENNHGENQNKALNTFIGLDGQAYQNWTDKFLEISLNLATVPVIFFGNEDLPQAVKAFENRLNKIVMSSYSATEKRNIICHSLLPKQFTGIRERVLLSLQKNLITRKEYNILSSKLEFNPSFFENAKQYCGNKFIKISYPALLRLASMSSDPGMRTADRMLAHLLSEVETRIRKDPNKIVEVNVNNLEEFLDKNFMESAANMYIRESGKVICHNGTLDPFIITAQEGGNGNGRLTFLFDFRKEEQFLDRFSSYAEGYIFSLVKTLPQDSQSAILDFINKGKISFQISGNFTQKDWALVSTNCFIALCSLVYNTAYSNVVFIGLLAAKGNATLVKNNLAENMNILKRYVGTKIDTIILPSMDISDSELRDITRESKQIIYNLLNKKDITKNDLISLFNKYNWKYTPQDCNNLLIRLQKTKRFFNEVKKNAGNHSVLYKMCYENQPGLNNNLFFSDRQIDRLSRINSNTSDDFILDILIDADINNYQRALRNSKKYIDQSLFGFFLKAKEKDILLNKENMIIKKVRTVLEESSDMSDPYERNEVQKVNISFAKNSTEFLKLTDIVPKD